MVYTSSEANKLLRAFGIGRDFICSGFEMSLELVESTTYAVYAVLTPGIYVQDTTVIDFQDSTSNNINLKLYSASNLPGPGTVIYVGSQYYHGTVGDGIDAVPTYATLLKTQSLTSYANFTPFYKITILSGFDGIKDLTNIQIERVIPSLKYNGSGTPSVSYVCADDGLKVYGDDRESSEAMLWALVL